MRLFVTGGTGFIGSHFVRHAIFAGHDVTVLRSSKQSRPRIPLPDQPRWIDGALSSVGVNDLRGHDALIHMAAVGVSPQKATLDHQFKVNVLESLDIWSKAVHAGLENLIVIGSCLEYGKSGDRYHHIPIDAPLEPTTSYGASKAAASLAAIALSSERRIRLQILRPFNVYGVGQHESNLWPSLQKAAGAGGDFPMTAGEQVRDFIPVERVAYELLAACHDETVQPGSPTIVNLGTGEPQTIRQFAEYWWNKWNAAGKLRIGELPYREGEVMRYVPLVRQQNTQLYKT
jgi:nucleoside-diphosphate-sugar epimerase